MNLRLTLDGRTSARLRCERTGAEAVIRARDLPDEPGFVGAIEVGETVVEFGRTDYSFERGGRKSGRAWISAPAHVRIIREKAPAPPAPPARTLADYRARKMEAAGA